MKYIKTILVATIVVIGSTFCPCDNHSAAAGEIEIPSGELEVGVASRHVWRGSLGSDAMVIQPSLTVPFENPLGGTTSLNLWGNTPINGSVGSEFDLSLSQSLDEYGTITVSSYYYGGEYANIESHDIDLILEVAVDDINLTVSRILISETVEGDNYIEAGYALNDEFDLFVGVGDGGYSADGGMDLVNAGFVFEMSQDNYGRSRWGGAARMLRGYTLTFVYNPSTETPNFVVSRRW